MQEGAFWASGAVIWEVMKYQYRYWSQSREWVMNRLKLSTFLVSSEAFSYASKLAMGKPLIVDRYVKRIIDTEKIYSGVYARISINFYAFNSNVNKMLPFLMGNHFGTWKGKSSELMRTDLFM